jgi:hypothetical protein
MSPFKARMENGRLILPTTRHDGSVVDLADDNGDGLTGEECRVLDDALSASQPASEPDASRGEPPSQTDTPERS